MGGMGSLYIGVSGLQASQNALNTTAHNLANIGTTGYVRQQVVQSDTLYNTIKYGAVSQQQVGIGTTVAQVRQVRDTFLDMAYRLESGRANFYAVGYSAYYEIESILGTLGGSEFSDSLDNLNEAFNQLAGQPDDTSYQTLLKQRSVSFLEDAQNVYDLLKEYQNSLNDQIIDTVDRINELASTIYELNKQISGIESGGVENANDLRDTRNLALDELAGLINISYSEDSNGIVTVRAESNQLVGEGYLAELGYTVDGETGFATPTWVSYKNAAVFDMSRAISTDTDTDVGKLKALVLQRGSDVATYTKIPVSSSYQNSDGTWATGSWDKYGNACDASEAVYTDGKKAYAAATNYYNTFTAMSGMTNTMAEFDQLIHTIVTAINDILSPNISQTVDATETWTDADGNVLAAGTYKVLDQENCGQSADGTIGTELFSRAGTERYTVYTNAAGEKLYVYNEEDPSNPKTLYTLDNLEVNSEVLTDVGKLPLYTANGSVDFEKGQALYNVWSEKLVALNPNATSKATFQDYYSKLYTSVGNLGSVYKSISDSLETTATGFDDDRQMVIGVSSDEELSNMIKYQNAYNAASRYMNVVSEMLEHIIVSLAS
ncbi:flagellar hook-associated protein FlgK [Konateibacter massiliensis]|uniref:flagellar hook-associated protein FlgK n=1 Tax=Konateibacter massiliensis TaxID=2002841 RepID=UPI000C15A778|nr:flagellar hook-associated protein FlgK [Konateibacter massiliensis]